MVLANNVPVTYTLVYASADSPYDAYKAEPIGSRVAAIGLQDQGKPVTSTSVSVTNGNCAPLSTTSKGTVGEGG